MGDILDEEGAHKPVPHHIVFLEVAQQRGLDLGEVFPPPIAERSRIEGAS